MLKGHDGVRQVLSVYQENFDQLQAEPLEFIEADDRLVVPFRLSGRPKGGGERLSIELVHVWQVEGEKAKRVDVYSSKAQALEAVGIGSEES